MSYSTTPLDTRRRQPLAPFRKLHIAALIGVALGLVYLQSIILQMLVIPLVIIAVITLVVASVVARGWRWALLLGAGWIVLVGISNGSNIVYNLARPAQTHEFVFNVVFLVISVIGIVAATGAWQQARASTTPRWLSTLLAGVLCFGGGAVAVALLPRTQTGAGVSDAALVELPTVTAANFAFAPAELRATVGETVALRLENTDNTGHSFDIDALNVHTAMPVGEPTLALFKPTAAGEYKVYCSIPGHEAMRGTLIVAPQ